MIAWWAVKKTKKVKVFPACCTPRDNDLCLGCLDWTLGKNFLISPRVQYWNMSPRDAVESPPSETFQPHLPLSSDDLVEPAFNPELEDLQRFSPTINSENLWRCVFCGIIWYGKSREEDEGHRFAFCLCVQIRSCIIQPWYQPTLALWPGRYWLPYTHEKKEKKKKKLMQAVALATVSIFGKQK